MQENMTWRFVTLVNGVKEEPVTLNDGQEYSLRDSGRFYSSVELPGEYTFYPAKASLVKTGIYQHDSEAKVVRGRDSLLVNTFRFHPVRIITTLGFYYKEGTSEGQIKRKEIELSLAYRLHAKER